MGNNLAKVTEALKLLEETLGAKLIKAEVHKIAGWNPESTPGIHPLVLLWYKCREELALANLTGSVPNSSWIQELRGLADLIQYATTHPQHEQIASKLRLKESVAEAIQELEILNNQSKS